MEKFIFVSETEIANIVENTLRKVLLQTTSKNDDAKVLPEIMNISQASEYLSLAKQTLYGFTSKGDIPYIKRGKKLYFKKSELNSWLLNENKQA